jgi:hypothetical protein
MRGATIRVPEDLPRPVDLGHPGDGIGAGSEIGVVALRKAPVSDLDDLHVRLGVDLQDPVRVERS